MYWSDHGNKTIRRANLDGSGMEVLISSGLYSPSSLALSIVPTEIQRNYIPVVQFSE
jgi:hypothetical protein